MKWFRNLVDCFGDAAQIRLASKEKRPVAAILTIRHKDTLVYKYGCSDHQFHNLGGMQLLFWKSIQEAKCDGLGVFDLGRTDCDNAGLIEFKDRWGAARSVLIYSRFTSARNSKTTYELGSSGWKAGCARSVIAHLPNCMFSLVGRLLYRHVG
jgi:lipid II:glycine glycyltransferase (peptidoglycan interpeptide bridge formation enzyme)